MNDLDSTTLATLVSSMRPRVTQWLVCHGLASISRSLCVKDLHIDLKSGPIGLKLSGGTNFGSLRPNMTTKITSDKKPAFFMKIGLSVFRVL